MKVREFEISIYGHDNLETVQVQEALLDRFEDSMVDVKVKS